jgi:hypothetical protein
VGSKVECGTLEQDMRDVRVTEGGVRSKGRLCECCFGVRTCCLGSCWEQRVDSLGYHEPENVGWCSALVALVDGGQKDWAVWMLELGSHDS